MYICEKDQARQGFYALNIDCIQDGIVLFCHRCRSDRVTGERLGGGMDSHEEFQSEQELLQQQAVAKRSTGHLHLHRSWCHFLDDSADLELVLDRRSEPCACIKSSIYTRPHTSPYRLLTSLASQPFIRRCTTAVLTRLHRTPPPLHVTVVLSSIHASATHDRT